jgi:hypothetical protein
MLTDAQVIEIRNRATQGEEVKNLALEFGISHSTARGIVNGNNRAKAGGPIKPRRIVDDELRFWSLVDWQGRTNEECWLWLGFVSLFGYGRFYFNKRLTGAHEVALFLGAGRGLFTGEVVMHSCDNRLCCNPHHLSAGTQAENLADMRQKNRHSHGEQHAAIMKKAAARGEKQHRAKLTEADVREIRKQLADRSLGVTALSRKYGVYHHVITCIAQRKTWAHVT